MRTPVFTRHDSGEITVDGLPPVIEISDELLVTAGTDLTTDWGLIVLGDGLRIRIKVANADCHYRFLRRDPERRSSEWAAEGE